MSDEVQLNARIPDELKRLVDADPRDNADVVEAALWTEFGGHREPGLERRLNEQQRRVDQIESEIDSREDELTRERDRLEAYRAKLERKRSHREATLSDAEDAIQPHMLTTDNPATKNWADKANMTPEEFIEAMQARFDDGD